MNELLKLVYETMDKKQADDITIIDFRGHSPYVDYFVIASARNLRLAHAILEEVEETVEKNGYEILHRNTTPESRWQLLDLGEIVIHVFCEGEREVYDLEGLWKDLPLIEL